MYFAWENLRGGFCCCWFHFCIFISYLYLHFIFDLHFVVVPHLFFFFIHIFFSASSLTLPWTIARFLHPFYNFSPTHRRVIRDTPFHYLLTASATVLSGHFLPTGVFYPTLLYQHFICAYERFPGSRKFFLEACRASYWSSKHRPGPSVCLIHSNPQSSYSERFSFKFYHILSWIACGESLIYLLLTRFKLFSLVQSHM